MIDYNNLPDESINQQVFFGNIDAANWQTWQKPKNCKYVYITAIGSGGGGGAGRRSASNNTSGGGGGGSGAITSGFFQAIVLPDVLYVQVGPGGIGGIGPSIQASGGPGTNGEISYVAVGPNTGTAYIVLQSGTVAAGGGPGGTLNAVAGGLAETAWGATGAFTNTGQVITVAGQAGGVGNLSSSPGGSITLNKIVTGGAGGGGTSASTTTSGGGSITGAGIVPTISGIAGGITGIGTTLGAANSGYQTRMPGKTYTARDPLLFTGGAGAGGMYVTTGTGIAGSGGNGSLGSGGGGGGGLNFSNATFGKSGNGGRGGDGLVIITSF